MPDRAPTSSLARLALLLVVLAALPAVAAPERLRVLFVGNSLTESNSLPQLVESVATLAGGPRIVARQATHGDYSLEDHWYDRVLNARARIRNKRWDFVVMQQGPSSLDASRALLREFVARFAVVIRRRGGEPAVYQVWPARDQHTAFPAVLESYRIAAADVGAPLLAVGAAWQAAWALDPTLELYEPDGFHPSRLGSYLAALVIYEGLTGRSAVGVPATLVLRDGRRFAIPEAQAATLQLAAEAVRPAAPD